MHRKCTETYNYKIFHFIFRDPNYSQLHQSRKYCNKIFLKNFCKIKKELTNINSIKNISIDNKLIDIIAKKNIKIQELNEQIIPLNNQLHELNNDQQIIIKQITSFESLTLNNIVITSRSKDNYINATQLCQAGNKKFSHWYCLNNTKQLINELASDTGIPALELIDVKKGNSSNITQGSWIHPDLAVQLIQWISPKFAIQVSKWIRKLLTDNKVEINVKLQKDNKLKDARIKLLEDTYLKKHKRENYPEKNIIYMLSTISHQKDRIYIIGKTTNLKKRLSTYNKTCEHQVIYYKECKNKDDMNIIELMILNKLDQYREKANRDRFILPVEKDILFFTNIIDYCVLYQL